MEVGDESHEASVWVTGEPGEEGGGVVTQLEVGATAVNGSVESRSPTPDDDIIPPYMRGTGSVREKRIQYEVELLTRGIRDPALIAYARKLVERRFRSID